MESKLEPGLDTRPHWEENENSTGVFNAEPVG